MNRRASFSRRVAIACVAMLSVLAAGCACAQLYSSSVKEPASTNPKPLEVYYREIERNDGFSIIEYRYISGASVPASLFGLRGNCAIAQREQWSHFASERIDSPEVGWTRYRLFRASADAMDRASNEPGRIRTIALADCAFFAQ